jgi:hypothetical protein
VKLLFPVACWLLVGLSPAALADDSKDPVEVDFAPLPTGQTDFALYYDFHTHGDHSISGVRLIERESVTEIRDDYFEKLKEKGWIVKAEGKTKLIIYGRKDDPIQKVEFKVDTFKFKPKGNVTPTVKRIKEG